MVREYKQVTYKHLIIGQEIKGTQEPGRSIGFTAYVKDINPNFVTVALWSPDGTEEKISTSAMFTVKMSDEEFKAKYREKAKEVLKNIQNKLLLDEIGYHEMWNSWLHGTPYEIASYCVKEKIRIVGHSTDITNKIAMFSGETLDVGVCAEYEDGERFWCHYRSSDIEKMLEMYSELVDSNELKESEKE